MIGVKKNYQSMVQINQNFQQVFFLHFRIELGAFFDFLWGANFSFGGNNLPCQFQKSAYGKNRFHFYRINEKSDFLMLHYLLLRPITYFDFSSIAGAVSRLGLPAVRKQKYFRLLAKLEQIGNFFLQALKQPVACCDYIFYI